MYLGHFRNSQSRRQKVLEYNLFASKILILLLLCFIKCSVETKELSTESKKSPTSGNFFREKEFHEENSSLPIKEKENIVQPIKCSRNKNGYSQKPLAERILKHYNPFQFYPVHISTHRENDPFLTAFSAMNRNTNNAGKKRINELPLDQISMSVPVTEKVTDSILNRVTVLSDSAKRFSDKARHVIGDISDYKEKHPDESWVKSLTMLSNLSLTPEKEQETENERKQAEEKDSTPDVFPVFHLGKKASRTELGFQETEQRDLPVYLHPFAQGLSLLVNAMADSAFTAAGVYDVAASRLENISKMRRPGRFTTFRAKKKQQQDEDMEIINLRRIVSQIAEATKQRYKDIYPEMSKKKQLDRRIREKLRENDFEILNKEKSKISSRKINADKNSKEFLSHEQKKVFLAPRFLSTFNKTAQEHFINETSNPTRIMWKQSFHPEDFRSRLFDTAHVSHDFKARYSPPIPETMKDEAFRGSKIQLLNQSEAFYVASRKLQGMLDPSCSMRETKYIGVASTVDTRSSVGTCQAACIAQAAAAASGLSVPTCNFFSFREDIKLCYRFPSVENKISEAGFFSSASHCPIDEGQSRSQSTSNSPARAKNAYPGSSRPLGKNGFRKVDTSSVHGVDSFFDDHTVADISRNVKTQQVASQKNYDFPPKQPAESNQHGHFQTSVEHFGPKAGVKRVQDTFHAYSSLSHMNDQDMLHQIRNTGVDTSNKNGVENFMYFPSNEESNSFLPLAHENSPIARDNYNQLHSLLAQYLTMKPLVQGQQAFSQDMLSRSVFGDSPTTASIISGTRSRNIQPNSLSPLSIMNSTITKPNDPHLVYHSPPVFSANGAAPELTSTIASLGSPIQDTATSLLQTTQSLVETSNAFLQAFPLQPLLQAGMQLHNSNFFRNRQVGGPLSVLSAPPLGVQKQMVAPPPGLGKPKVICASAGMTCCVPERAVENWKDKAPYLNKHSHSNRCKAHFTSVHSALCATTPYTGDPISSPDSLYDVDKPLLQDDGEGNCGLTLIETKNYLIYRHVLTIPNRSINNVICECKESKVETEQGVRRIEGFATWEYSKQAVRSKDDKEHGEKLAKQLGAALALTSLIGQRGQNALNTMTRK